MWWESLGFDGRRKRMLRWTSYLAKRVDEICDLCNRETAKPKGDGLFELLAGLEELKWAANNAERVLKQRKVKPGLAMINFDARVAYLPLGVAGIITPWNAPLYTVFCGLADALGAGNAAIVKPSEYAAATGVYAVESFYGANPDAPEGAGLVDHRLRRDRVRRCAGRAWTRSRSPDRCPPAAGSCRPAPRTSRRCCSNSAARTRRSSPRTPTSTRRPRRSSGAACGTPARRASASSAYTWRRPFATTSWPR